MSQSDRERNARRPVRSFRMASPDEYRELSAAAKRNGESTSDLIRRAVARELARIETKGGAMP